MSAFNDAPICCNCNEMPGLCSCEQTSPGCISIRASITPDLLARFERLSIAFDDCVTTDVLSEDMQSDIRLCWNTIVAEDLMAGDSGPTLTWPHASDLMMALDIIIPLKLGN